MAATSNMFFFFILTQEGLEWKGEEKLIDALLKTTRDGLGDSGLWLPTRLVMGGGGGASSSVVAEAEAQIR